MVVTDEGPRRTLARASDESDLLVVGAGCRFFIGISDDACRFLFLADRQLVGAVSARGRGEAAVTGISPADVLRSNSFAQNHNATIWLHFQLLSKS